MVCDDEKPQRRGAAFVIAGGGFAGAETAGAINHFVRETANFYPHLGDEEIRVVVIHPGDYLLPDLGEELGRYAEGKLRERKVEVIKGARVASYDGWVVTLNNGISIPVTTLIWTAGGEAQRGDRFFAMRQRKGSRARKRISASAGLHRTLGGPRLRGSS